MAVTHRRLVCFCRLTEVTDINKREKKANAHQRGVFLFNDLLVVTKPLAGRNGKKSSRKNSVHQFRSSIRLSDVRVNVFSAGDHLFGIQLQDRLTGKVALTFNARSDDDRRRLVNDLQESVAEMAEMDKAKMFLNQQADNGRARGDAEGQESFC